MESKQVSPRNRVLRYLPLTLIAMILAFCSSTSFAHPMGNFSISHYSAITVQGDSVDVLYLIDMAEIPTFQEMQEAGLTARLDDPKLQSYLTAKSGELASGLTLTVDGHKVML